VDVRDPLETNWEIDAAAIFQPEVVLPEQLESLRGRSLEGPLALMLAILEEAILCVQGVGRCRAADAREAGRARRWVRDRDRSWLFSFENICAALDVDADSLRASLLGNGSKGGRLLTAGRTTSTGDAPRAA
jgi:hypothetical protein